MHHSIAQKLRDFKPNSDVKHSSRINKILFEGKELKVRKDKRV